MDIHKYLNSFSRNIKSLNPSKGMDLSLKAKRLQLSPKVLLLVKVAHKVRLYSHSHRV